MADLERIQVFSNSENRPGHVTALAQAEGIKSKTLGSGMPCCIFSGYALTIMTDNAA